MIGWMKEKLDAAILRAYDDEKERRKLIASRGESFVDELDAELARVNAARMKPIGRKAFMGYVRKFDDLELASFFCREYPQQGDDVLRVLVDQAAQVAWIRDKMRKRLEEDRRGLAPPLQPKTPEVDR